LTGHEPLPPFDPSDPAIRADPYPHYRRYRESDPVHRTEPPDKRLGGRFYLFRHGDVVEALRDPRLGRDWRRLNAALKLPPELDELQSMFYRWMLIVDPPHHTRLRGTVSHAFRPRRATALASYVEARAEALLDEALASGKGFDGVRQYALPLTVGAIAELLGVPEERREEVFRSIRALGAIFTGEGTGANLGGAARSAAELSRIFRELLMQRADAPEDDLLSELAAGLDPESEALREAIATCVLLFGAGFATTVHAMSAAILTLLRHPRAWAALRDERANLERAVEELLRYEPPLHGNGRISYEDLEIGGVEIPRASLVSCLIGSANRDPDIFPDPERLDLGRDARAHLTFGQGIHSCLGSPLARLEIRTALAVLLRRLPELSLGSQRVEWTAQVGRGPTKLPLVANL